LAVTVEQNDPSATLYGVGGSRMEAAGVQIIHKTNHLGSVGVTEPLSTLPGVLRSFLDIRSGIKKKRPDVAVLVGHDVFHFFLARWLRRKRIPTISYFPPQVWLWRKLAGPIARSFDQILTSFPEEHDVYSQASGRTEFVGHYLSDLVEERNLALRDESRRRLGIETKTHVIGLFPGSRIHEIDVHTPVCLDAVSELVARDPFLRFVLSVADPCFWDDIQTEVHRRHLGKYVQLCRDNRTAMTACDLLLLCSGTVTLEAALMRIPMVIFYRLSSLTVTLVRFFITIGLLRSDTIGLPNLLSGRQIIRELHQSEVEGSRLAEEARTILDDPDKQAAIRKDLDLLSTSLGPQGSLQRAVNSILKHCKSDPLPLR